MATSDLGDWYRSIPPITKYWFTGSVIFPIIGKLQLLHPYWMVLNFNLTIYKFQLWRPLTAVLFYPTGFHYLINLYFLYSYSTRLETGVFDGRPADYVFMLGFNWIFIVIIGFALELGLLMDLMIMSALYVWCQLNRDEIVSFWFGTRFKAMYLPWVLLAFNMIIGPGGVSELIGILVGHAYFFLMFKYPQDFGGARLLQTPGFLYNWLPNRQGGVSGFGMAPSSRQQRTDTQGGGNRHRWGHGQQLGGN